MFNWGQFLTYAFVTSATPGPNNLLSMSNAGRLGFKKALPFNLGIWAGFFVVAAICTLFCSLLSSVLPKAVPVMKVLGAGYMLYLAYKTFRSKPELEEKSGHSGFAAGITLQFVNPKIYVYIIMSLEAYILPYFHGQVGTLLAFALLLSAIGAACTVCWAGFGSVFRLLFTKYAKATNAIMALLLVYCAISLLL